MQEQNICGAKTRSGEPCKNAPMENGRCRMHGGKALAGLAHPRAKTLRRSKYLPIQIVDAYEDSHKRGTLELIEDNIHTREALLSEALKALNDGGKSERAAKEIDKLIGQLVKQLAGQPDMAVVDHLISRMRVVNDELSRYFDAARTVNDLLDAQSKDLERRAKIDMHEAQTINLKQLGAFFQSLRASMEKNISNPKERRAVLSDVSENFRVIRGRTG